ncbi:hypothetical protein MH171_001900 [Vibrio parahaemolyticus]|uniref:hypothetical protein n=1 Tax=Vibrio scophthalmi TaxID=45658 RepID=UPI0022835AA4|nr:hypothetical protein [Vibrio scophthalmi]EIW7861971.1 hypothetical protein [Vibrio parahaemolyticus]ELA7254430.1 hypothetical protein [Vibrio parahaemolyticus]EMF1839599.1 hypothetical protein [Vibrio parahaemolyticus]MCY9804382.1 hypothetical protein [Vibrio scophthalmi]
MKVYKVKKLKRFLKNEIEVAEKIANYVSKVSLDYADRDDISLYVEFIRCSIIDFFLLESDIDTEDYDGFVKYLGILNVDMECLSERKEMIEIIELMLTVSYGLSKNKTKKQAELLIKSIKENIFKEAA